MVDGFTISWVLIITSILSPLEKGNKIKKISPLITMMGKDQNFPWYNLLQTYTLPCKSTDIYNELDSRLYIYIYIFTTVNLSEGSFPPKIYINFFLSAVSVSEKKYFSSWIMDSLHITQTLFQSLSFIMLYMISPTPNHQSLVYQVTN